MSDHKEYAVGIDDLFWIEAGSDEEAIEKLQSQLEGTDPSDLTFSVHESVELDDG